MLRPFPINVNVYENYKLLLEFNNGEKKFYDALLLLTKKVYEKLKDPTFFKKVRTNGITVEWNDEIDICPDELYYSSIPIE